ncbi:hypothetical protein EK21DRAFT_68006 [Setomelanomma holmii]|uniref:rRNA-processing protein EFG1 n=1 Tax=Setomelanomma holmii TaxID=210430 RepID=A0A9P4H6X4_9PLEO|nr:hypothetical protein EK21DRAFT_68006 [Setomelanomma holmii]
MSQKRKHGDTVDGDAASKPFKKHRSFKPGQSHQQPKHHKRPNVSHDDENGRSVNALKSRIRDLKRLLAHVENVPKHKMSAGARQERERELEACEHELDEKLRGSREAEYRKKMIGKYHQVRFFEADRQKGTRILKRLKKELATTEDKSERTRLQQRVHNVEVDVNYAIYYPLMKPYSSLYPKSKSRKNDESDGAGDDEEDSKNKSDEIDGPKGDVEMWKAVENAMQDGTLEKLRYSKDAVPGAPSQKSKKPKVKDGKKEKPDSKSKYGEQKSIGSQAYAAQEEDEDSEGGFFE